MNKFTQQMEEWNGQFGKQYTDRNAQSITEMNNLYKKNFGLSREEINEEFLGDLSRSLRILEVGTNVGVQLMCLQKMGFINLYGIELQSYAVEKAKKNTVNINIIQGSAFDIPFKDNFFDLVYTSGVLIHISPNDIGEVIKEVYRCTNRYIWGLEYFAESYTEIKYRGNNDLLWKANFPELYLTQFPDLKVVKKKKYKYVNEDNVDIAFLLEKTVS